MRNHDYSEEEMRRQRRNSRDSDSDCCSEEQEDQTYDSSNLGLDSRDTNVLWSSRRKMAWISLWAIIIPTIVIILGVKDVNLIENLADLMSWYYLALASITGAYMGFKSWATIRGRTRNN